jgi:hypothetical protein
MKRNFLSINKTKKSLTIHTVLSGTTNFIHRGSTLVSLILPQNTFLKLLWTGIHRLPYLTVQAKIKSHCDDNGITGLD